MSLAGASFRDSTDKDDELIAQHYLDMWLAIGIPEDELHADRYQQSIDFIREARAKYQLKSVIAEVDGQPAGSASSHVAFGLYPLVFKSKRKLGYIWGVWVDPKYRHQGIALELIKKSVEYLRSIDCTRAVLHASDEGRHVYKKLGFLPSRAEMELELSETVPSCC